MRKTALLLRIRYAVDADELNRKTAAVMNPTYSGIKQTVRHRPRGHVPYWGGLTDPLIARPFQARRLRHLPQGNRRFSSDRRAPGLTLLAERPALKTRHTLLFILKTT